MLFTCLLVAGLTYRAGTIGKVTDPPEEFTSGATRTLVATDSRHGFIQPIESGGAAPRSWAMNV